MHVHVAVRPVEGRATAGGNSVRKALAILAAAALLLIPVGVAQANTVTTFHIHAGAVGDVGPTGCTPGDFIVTFGNAVEHDTINNAGDEWFTATVTGTFVTTDGSGYAGHITAWFGVEANAKNFVTHFTANAQGTLGDGTPLRVHQEGQFTMNALGLPVVNNMTFTCS
jgi:hypothetical protein